MNPTSSACLRGTDGRSGVAASVPFRLRSSVLMPLVLLLALLAAGCGQDRPDLDPESRGVLVIQGGTVLTSSMSDPIEDGVVVLIDGVIEAVGPRGQVQIPPAARRVTVSGLFVIPGLWNADVRIPEELLALADTASDAELGEALEERFTRYGFVSVVETSTPAAELEVLLERIRSGAVSGPRVVSAGPGLPAGFERTVGGGGRDLSAGLQGAAADEAPGAAARRAADLAERGIALVPALTRASYPAPDESPEESDRRLISAMDEVGSFSLLGGTLVFGTGSGYVPEYDPFSEYILLDEAGVTSTELFDALTIGPAFRLGHDYTGMIEPGMVADLVVVEGDPISDPTSLARVRWVLKEGITLFNVLGR